MTNSEPFTPAHVDTVDTKVVTSPLSKEFLHPNVMARELGFSRRKLDELHAKGLGPPRIKIGRRVLYSRASVRAWLLEREEDRRRRSRR